MRALMVLPDLAGGGAERTALELLAHLDRSRVDAALAVLRPQGEHLGAARVLEPPGPWARALSMRAPPASIRRGVIDAPRIAALLARERPDALMTSMADVSIPALFARAALPPRMRPRWIAREGNHVGMALDHDVTSDSARAIVRHLGVLAYRAADAIVVPSAGVAGELSRRFHVPRAKIEVIGNPVDIERIARERDRAPSVPLPARFVLGAGRLVRQKGFDRLLRAFAALRRPELHLVVAGEGPEHAALERLARELGVARRVRLVGFVHDLWALMARAEVFCLSSRWEGFASVVVEAMACGAPLVVTDCDYGPKEIVRDGEHGLVARSDARAIEAALRSVLSDPAAARERASAARLRARDFDARVIASRYEAVLAGRRSTAARGG